MNYPLCLLFVTLNKLCEANQKKIGNQRRSRQRFKASIPTFSESNVSNKSFGHTSSLSFQSVEKNAKKKKKRRWREKWHTSWNPWADWSVFEPRMGSRAKGILTSLSTGTGELDTLLTSQNHSMMDLPSYVVHHLSADNFQSVLRELSFIKQFMQPMNSFLVLFNFKLKKRSERSNFKP